MAASTKEERRAFLELLDIETSQAMHRLHYEYRLIKRGHMDEEPLAPHLRQGEDTDEQLEPAAELEQIRIQFWIMYGACAAVQPELDSHGNPTNRVLGSQPKKHEYVRGFRNLAARL